MHKLIRLDKSTITPDNTHALDIWDFFFFFLWEQEWHLMNFQHGTSLLVLLTSCVCKSSFITYVKCTSRWLTADKHTLPLESNCLVLSDHHLLRQRLVINYTFLCLLEIFFFYYKMKCNITLQENYNKTITSALVNWINDIEKKNDLCESRDTKWNLK